MGREAKKREERTSEVKRYVRAKQLYIYC